MEGSIHTRWAPCVWDDVIIGAAGARRCVVGFLGPAHWISRCAIRCCTDRGAATWHTPAGEQGVGLFTHAPMLSHVPGHDHPECPARIQVILEALAGRYPNLARRSAPRCGSRTLCLVHDTSYVEKMLAGFEESVRCRVARLVSMKTPASWLGRGRQPCGQRVRSAPPLMQFHAVSSGRPSAWFAPPGTTRNAPRRSASVSLTTSQSVWSTHAASTAFDG